MQGYFSAQVYVFCHSFSFIILNGPMQVHLDMYAAPGPTPERKYMFTSKFTFSFYRSSDFSCRISEFFCIDGGE